LPAGPTVQKTKQRIYDVAEAILRRFLPRLPPYLFSRTLDDMEVHCAPDLQAEIDRLVIETGFAPDRLIQDALAGYVAELAGARQMLDTRYDDLKSGRVRPVDGEAFFESLRKREEELLEKA